MKKSTYRIRTCIIIFIRSDYVVVFQIIQIVIPRMKWRNCKLCHCLTLKNDYQTFQVNFKLFSIIQFTCLPKGIPRRSGIQTSWSNNYYFSRQKKSCWLITILLPDTTSMDFPKTQRQSTTKLKNKCIFNPTILEDEKIIFSVSKLACGSKNSTLFLKNCLSST